MSRNATAMVGNPLRSDPELCAMMEKLENVSSYNDFFSWKDTFLKKFESFLNEDGSTAALAAYSDFRKTQMEKVVRKVAKVAEYVESGDLSKERVSVKARNSMGELTSTLHMTSKNIQGLAPALAADEEEHGYTKYHLGAVLVRDGFQEYERMNMCNDIMKRLTKTCLGEAGDETMLEAMKLYDKEINRFVALMEDLGLIQIMLKCREFDPADRVKPKKEKKEEPKPKAKPAPPKEEKPKKEKKKEKEKPKTKPTRSNSMPESPKREPRTPVKQRKKYDIGGSWGSPVFFDMNSSAPCQMDESEIPLKPAAKKMSGIKAPFPASDDEKSMDSVNSRGRGRGRAEEPKKKKTPKRSRSLSVNPKKNNGWKTVKAAPRMSEAGRLNASADNLSFDPDEDDAPKKKPASLANLFSKKKPDPKETAKAEKQPSKHDRGSKHQKDPSAHSRASKPESKHDRKAKPEKEPSKHDRRVASKHDRSPKPEKKKEANSKPEKQEASPSEPSRPKSNKQAPPGDDSSSDHRYAEDESIDNSFFEFSEPDADDSSPQKEAPGKLHSKEPEAKSPTPQKEAPGKLQERKQPNKPEPAQKELPGKLPKEEPKEKTSLGSKLKNAFKKKKNDPLSKSCHGIGESNHSRKPKKKDPLGSSSEHGPPPSFSKKPSPPPQNDDDDSIVSEDDFLPLPASKPRRNSVASFGSENEDPPPAALNSRPSKPAEDSKRPDLEPPKKQQPPQQSSTNSTSPPSTKEEKRAPPPPEEKRITPSPKSRPNPEHPPSQSNSVPPSHPKTEEPQNKDDAPKDKTGFFNRFKKNKDKPSVPDDKPQNPTDPNKSSSIPPEPSRQKPQKQNPTEKGPSASEWMDNDEEPPTKSSNTSKPPKKDDGEDGGGGGESINNICFCGVDDSINPKLLGVVSQSYPSVEWAVLLRPDMAGQPRYASADYMKRLSAVAKESGGKMQIAAHLCGGFVDEVLEGDEETIGRLSTMGYKRIQLNTTAINGANTYQLERGVKAVLSAARSFPNVTLILQQNQETKALWEGVISSKPSPKNVALLWDESKGQGIVPSSWPSPMGKIPTGYAGGIGLGGRYMIKTTLKDIASSAGKNGDTWVSMESSLRCTRDGKDRFCIETCYEVLDVASECDVLQHPDFIPK